MSNTQHWPATPANHWSSNAFGNVNGPSRQPRALTLRHLICQACKALSNQSFEGTNGGFGYHSVDLIMHHIEHNRPPNEPIPPVQEILDICETEGNQQNGGGSLSLQDERGRGVCVKWIPDGSAAARPSAGAPGEIGSPVVGSSHLFGISRPFPGVTNNGF